MKLTANVKDVTKTVVPSDMCSGCGVCVGICPVHCIEMHMSEGKYRPILVGDCLDRCDLCLSVCPFYEHDRSITEISGDIFGGQKAIQHDQATGHYVQAFVGHSLVGDHRARGASGGMATWVLEQLLVSGEVDRVLAVGAVAGPGSRMFQYETYTTAEQVRGGASSKYYPVEISTALRAIWDGATDYRYAIIGLPCTLQAIRRAAARHPRLARRVRFLLGIVCNHCPGSYYTEFLCKLAGVSLSDVQRIDYRFKGSTSAIDYQFRALVNDTWSNPVGLLGLPSRVWNRQYFAYNACSYCDDVFAETSDAVFMDAWLPQYLPETRGTSIVLARNAALRDLLENGAMKGLCDLTPIPVEDVISSQGPVVHHKKDAISVRILARRKRGEWLPQMRAQPAVENGSIELRAANAEMRSVRLSNSLWTVFRVLPKGILPIYCSVVDWISQNADQPKRLVLRETAVKTLRVLGLYPILARFKQQTFHRNRLLRAPNDRISIKLLSGYAHASGCIRRFRELNAGPPSMLVLPPSSPGSLGDQAVLMALVQHARAKGIRNIAVVTCSDNDDWSYLDAVGQPSVLGGLFQYHSLRERLRFTNTVSRFDAFYVIGTDVLDGAYADKLSTSRLALAALAHAAGTETSVVSFSINAQPTPGVLQAFKDLSPQIRLCTRDAISNERLSEHLGRRVELSADIAFLLEPDYETAAVHSVRGWADAQRAAGRVIVGFNACREWMTFVPELTVDDIVRVCANAFAGLLKESQAASFAFVSHDVRGSVNDYSLARRIYEALPEPLQSRCMIVPPCSAREIKALSASLDFALSGRMHFAIACLGQSVPVAGITYQDKFEGLFQHFGLQGMAISPERAFLSEELMSFFLPLLCNREDLRQAVAKRLPAVRERASVNLVSLDNRLSGSAGK